MREATRVLKIANLCMLLAFAILAAVKDNPFATCGWLYAIWHCALRIMGEEW